MTVTRLTPMEFFCAVAAPLVENRCYPVLQVEVNNPDPTWPTIVYSGLSPETDTTLASGPFTTGLSLRYECRSDDWQETIELSAKVLTALRRGGRLRRIGAGHEEYNPDLEIYRRIQTVTLGR